MKKIVLAILTFLIAVLTLFVCLIWWYDHVPTETSIFLCIVTAAIGILSIWMIWFKIGKGKSKASFCVLTVVVLGFLLLIIFRNQIREFLFNIFVPIGPGGMIRPDVLP